MFSWIKRQMASFEKAHAEVTWEEALDTAIASINELKEVESEDGKSKLQAILKELKYH